MLPPAMLDGTAHGDERLQQCEGSGAEKHLLPPALAGRQVFQIVAVGSVRPAYPKWEVTPRIR